MSCKGNGQQNVIQDSTLNDFRRQGYFMKINIESKGTEYVAVISNSELFGFLYDNTGLTEESYIEKLSKLKGNKEVLKLDTLSLDESFLLIEGKHSKELEANVAKGKEHFLSTYFKNRCIKEMPNNADLAYIINKLLEWNLWTNIDGETGYLVYSSSPSQ